MYFEKNVYTIDILSVVLKGKRDHKRLVRSEKETVAYRFIRRINQLRNVKRTRLFTPF